MSEERYQFQPWPIKAYRWVRYRPKVLAMFSWWTLRWLLSGAQPGDCETRQQTLAMFWGVAVGTTDIDMGRWHTLEEVRQELG